MDASPQQSAEHLRVLIADENRDRLGTLARFVADLGHEVVAREIKVDEVAEATTVERPDVALVELGPDSGHALDLISEIVREASCPVIALLAADDPAFVQAAARRGVFAYIVDASPDELQSAIEITLHRFAEYQSLEGVLGRRIEIEQAKGMLMERHGIDVEQAFKLLHSDSSRSGRKVADIAADLIKDHTRQHRD